MAIDLRGRSSVSFYDTYSQFPIIGSDIVLYVDRDTLTMYIWNGTTYEPFSSGGGGGSTITVVANYSALPDVTTVNGQFYWCSAAQGTYWLPGSLGGTYYPSGIYYSNGVTWEYTPTPYNATQTDVDAGINDTQFVTPKTYIQGLTNWFTNSKLISVLGFTPVPTTRTINGYDLSANRTLNSSDVGAVAVNSAITGATKTKITYDSKGLVTSGADATTADISDSTNKRYVTDAQLTVIGNTSGTNTGDETQTTILSKLGFFISKTTTPSSNVTGTTETIVNSVTIGNNRFSSDDKLIIDSDFVKTTTLGTYILRYYLAPNANNLTSAVCIGTSASNASTAIYLSSFYRNHTIIGGNLKGYNFTTFANVPATTSGALSSTSFNVANTFYLITTVTFANTGDSGYLNSQLIKNF